MAADNSGSNSESTQRMCALVARLSADDVSRDLGDGWTVGFALAHLAFWDARQVAALQQYARGDGFPTEDYATNAALEGIAAAFDLSTVGQAAIKAARELDETVDSLTAEQIDGLRDAGLAYAIERAPHREEHLQQIEEALG